MAEEGQDEELKEVTDDIQEFLDEETQDGPGDLDSLEEGDVEQEDVESEDDDD